MEAQAETEHGMIMPMARARDDGAPVCIGGEIWFVLDRRRALNSTLVFVNLLLCPVGEHENDFRMTQGAILRRVSSAAMEVKKL